MRFAIKKVVLWPRNKKFSPRIIEFAPGKVNVITGASRTGKSALIPIIDYCLCSGSCSIPEGVIRDHCEWFGIVIDGGDQELLLARREPLGQKQTGDMFIIQGKTISVPEAIESKNSSSDAVKQILNDLCGLSNLGFDEGSDHIGDYRPSFRDVVKLSFQPQNIVANRDVLFYKASSFKHREKLRKIFPYVLGAVTPEVLQKQHELEELRKELNRKERDLSAVRDVSKRWQGEIQAKLATAVELGVISSEHAEERDWSKILTLLRQLSEKPRMEISIRSANIDAGIGALVEVQTEESSLSQALAKVRRRFAEMSKLKATALEYGDTLSIQRDRLSISSWLAKRVDSTAESKCPTCAQPSAAGKSEAERLLFALQTVENNAMDVSYAQASFDREFERVRQEVRKLTEALDAVRHKRQEIETQSKIAQDEQYTLNRIARFLGNIDEGLNNYERLGDDGKLALEVRELKARVNQLREELFKERIEEKTQRSLAKLSLFAGKVLPGLDCDKPNDPIQLSINDLTIKVSREQREYFLWEIGSGSNWLSYHIAISLAIQELCNEFKKSSVPSMLIIDQPTQVYFPALVQRPEVDEDLDPQLRDEDTEAVTKLFTVLDEAVVRLKGTLQIIVLDHAPQKIWQGLANTQTTEEWRGDSILVPKIWYS